jgi:protein phosphatase
MQPSVASEPIITLGSRTDVGRRRANNQDFMGSLYMEELPYNNAHLVVVADGMGGARGGEIASRIAVETIIAYFEDQPNLEPDLALREATEKASNAILAEVDINEGLRGMGTTCVSILVQNSWLFAAHVGDSRLYMLREGTLHRLSRDHSNVQRLVEAGILDEEKAATHPRRNVLSRVLGSEYALNVEVLAPPWKLRGGDRVLLCSDGLHGELSDLEIAQVLQEYPAQEAAVRLVDLANEAGGNDNTTVSLLYFDTEESLENPGQLTSADIAVEEEFHLFPNAMSGFIFYALVFVLFFLLGYLTGLLSTVVQKPKRRAALTPPAITAPLSVTPTQRP